MKRILFSLLIAMLPFGEALAQAPADKAAKVSLFVAEHELPNVPGKSLRAVLVEYEPGAGSPSHRHPASAFIYARVLEGAIRSKVNDAPERTYQAGESWTEKPGDHHQVSQNAEHHGARQAAGRIRGRHQRSSDRHSGQVAGGQVVFPGVVVPLQTLFSVGPGLHGGPSETLERRPSSISAAPTLRTASRWCMRASASRWRTPRPPNCA